jgi:hypothetical protein
MRLVALVVFFFASVVFGVGALTGVQLRAGLWQAGLLVVVVTAISMVLAAAARWLWRHPAPGTSRIPVARH